MSAYTIQSHDGGPMLQTTVTDALGRHAESYTDAKGRNRETVQHARGEDITVKYSYDPVGQVMTVQHPDGKETKYAYDLLGRKLMVNHPDAGETDMTYDAAGNLMTKLTAELRKSISDKGYISYTYDFERLHEVLYPENLFNRVTYTYGKAGDKYNRAGRLALVEDASGGEAYYYGRQGEVTKTVRTVMASVADIRTYVYGATYDSWNRVQTMTYPDGEVVTYHYNAAGQVESMTSNKQGRQSVIVDRIGYDKEGHTVYTKLGNGTETTYTYDKQRERLQVMNLTADGQTVMENRYQYDAVDNILGITNAANPTSLTKLNKAKLGGRSSHTYEYDELNRLVHANGKAKRASYDMVMSFGRMSEPLTKVQKVDSTTTAKSYNFAYKYEDSNHPTAPTQIGHDHYTYDANGNPTLVTNDSANTTREMYWDEDNRLMVLSDNGKTSRYTYNAAGERIMKSYGTMEGVYINGAPQGITFHETDNFTLYPASILSVNKNRFTKHYFLGDKRVASRIGTGLFNNVYGRNGSYVTAGQQDYAERMNQIQKQKEAYYKQQGIAPGVPTEKGAYGDPENTGVGYNAVLTELGNHDVPQGWIQTPRPNTTPNTNPGPPVSWNDPSNPDDPQAGYGYIPNDTTKEETFFYHSDHLGSTSYITDDKANITQYDAYLPYGELLVDEHSSSEDLPYKFNGKQFDDETGLYYYGARYMNPVTSLWYGVDPLAEKYVSTGGYVYTLDNPVKLSDIEGLYPKNVVIFHKTPFYLPDYYTLTAPVAHLLSLVSGVQEEYVKNLHVMEKGLGKELPWYPLSSKADEAGGAITLGDNPKYASTIMTRNYFEEDKSLGKNDFSNNTFEWLYLLSHEVRHLKHIEKAGSYFKYTGKFAKMYLKYFIKEGSFNAGHDKVPEEKEAISKSQVFMRFNNFVTKTLKYKGGLSALINNTEMTDSQKIKMIDVWWNQFNPKNILQLFKKGRRE